MYIKPQPVLLQDGMKMATIYDPDRKDRLPPEGRDVPMSDYWRRRLYEGSVIAAQDPESRTVVAPKPPKDA